MIFALYLAFTASRKRRPAANGWGGLRPEICENLGGKSEKIIDFWIAKRRGRGEKDENWLAARALVFVLDNAYLCGVKTYMTYLVNI